MRYLIVRTEVRAVAHDELTAAIASGRRIRDEWTAPEPRRQTVCAENREAAMSLARALSSVGSVRSGRQRVKVVQVPDPHATDVDQLSAPASTTDKSSAPASVR